MLPFGEGHKYLTDEPDRQRAARRLVDHAGGDDPERLPDGRSRSWSSTTNNFLFGGTPRPNLVPGPGHPHRGQHHRSHHGQRRGQPLLQQGARSRRRRSTRSATRRARCRTCCRRGATTSTCPSAKTCRPAARPADHPPRSAEHVQHRPVGGAGELGVRQLVVRPDQQPGQQHADDPVHAALRVLIPAAADQERGTIGVPRFNSRPFLIRTAVRPRTRPRGRHAR